MVEITTTLISGDEDESTVFASSYSDDLSILFSFSYDTRESKSVNSRIAACFHELEVTDPECSFPSREEMRQALYAAIAQIWVDCASHPRIRSPDVLVQVTESPSGEINGRISHESSYREYAESLESTELCQSSLTLGAQTIRTTFAPLESLRFSTVLRGRGDTTIAHMRGDMEPQTTYVFKGLSFRLFLEGQPSFSDERQAFYRELGLIFSLPRHPNIVSPPPFLVTTDIPSLDTASATENKNYICGALYPYFQRGSLQDVIDRSNRTGDRVPLTLQAKWARQITSALAATHASHQYHMDLKPNNVLIDDDENAVLIDWEHSGASPFFTAPEADGSWDLEIERLQMDDNRASQSSNTRLTNLIYRKYTGPPRENNWTWPRWNVFPIWQVECPEALRAAEMYSLGRTLWVLFDQVDQEDFVDDRDSFTPGPISWGLRTTDIPSCWKGFVNKCVDPDPNVRPGLDAAVSFSEQELKVLGCP